MMGVGGGGYTGERGGAKGGAGRLRRGLQRAELAKGAKVNARSGKDSARARDYTREYGCSTQPRNRTETRGRFCIKEGFLHHSRGI